MHLTDEALEIALPILERAQAEQGPWIALEEMIERMRAHARRRGLAYRGESEQLLARAPVSANGNGTLAGPVVPGVDAGEG